MAKTTINISSQNNQPPNQSGWVVVNVDYNTPKTLTISNFTTETEPEYEDPEGDPLGFVKFETVPPVGTLTNNGLTLVSGDVVTASELSAGNIVYTPVNDSEGYRSGGTFFVQDTQSGQYNSNSNRYQFAVSDNINQPPSSVGDGEEDIILGESFVFSVSDLTIDLNPSYFDEEGDLPSKLLIEVVPEFGLLKFDGNTVVNGQEIDFYGSPSIDNGDLIYISQEFPDDGSEIFQFKISDVGSGEFTG